MSSLAHRQRNALQETEDASELRLGREFAGATAFSLSEIKILLDQQALARAARGHLQDSEVLKKTEAYVNQFAKFTSTEHVQSTRGILSTAGLQSFEIAQLLNLCPENAEEAKALIPSLADRSDDDLDDLLKQLNHQRAFKAA